MGFLTFQYKVEALDFIIKDDAKHIHSKIHECLLDVDEKYASLKNSANKTFIIAIDDRRIVIDYDDIIFFTTSTNIHKVILHGKNRIIEFGAQLKEVEQQLDFHFFRCHRSYIINLSQIAEVDFEQATVTMNTGEICPVSTRAKKNLKKHLDK